MGVHKALQILRSRVDLQHFCGYVTMLNASSQLASRKLSEASDERGQSLFGSLVRSAAHLGWNSAALCRTVFTQHCTMASALTGFESN
jgi:hypothetical protein